MTTFKLHFDIICSCRKPPGHQAVVHQMMGLQQFAGLVLDLQYQLARVAGDIDVEETL